MTKINNINVDRLDDNICWTSEESDEFWEQLVEDMENEGYNHNNGEYYWTEFSHYKYDHPTDWFYDIEDEESELYLYID
jgi:hypothetical protein